MESEVDKEVEPVSDELRPVEVEPKAIIDAIMETKNEVLQLEEMRNHTEKLKEDLVFYVTDILRTYELDLRIPTSSVPNMEDAKGIYLNGTGIVSYHYPDGAIKSQRLLDHSPSELLSLLSAALPCLNANLKLKRKEYEDTNNLLAKIGKSLLFLNEKAVKPIDQR